ncbi:MAG: glycoside hydrolase family 5 protein [Proteobacteria bacterium]|nr:glycoside hydrolase family 5 protein [Pseudomonadota bacterium]
MISGVNLPVLLGAYGHDLALNPKYPHWGFEITPLLAYRYLAMSRVLGFGAVRIWLCENGEGVLTDDQGRITGVAPELLDAVRILQHGAEFGGMQIYWTLLDANAWQHDRCAITRSVASDLDQARRFAGEVAAPLVEAMDPETVFAVEVFNEPETLSTEVRPDDGVLWPDLVRSIRAIKAVIPYPVTSGTQAIFLPGMASDGELPVDAVDLHVYHPGGGLPSREDLPVDIGDRPLLAGECGTHSDGSHEDALVNFLFNARSLGYEAAFLWKLEGELVTWRRYEERDTEGFELHRLGERIQHLLTNEWR